MLEAKARDDRYDLGRPHLGLPAAGGGHFRFGQFFRAQALLQSMEHNLEVGIGQNTRDAGKGGKTSIVEAAGQALHRGRDSGTVKSVAGKCSPGIGR